MSSCYSFPLLFLSPQSIICFENFPIFPKLKSSFSFFHGRSTALFHGNIFEGKFRGPLFFFFSFYFNSIRKLPQFKDGFVSTMFAVCSVLIVNSYMKASVHITLSYGPSKCTKDFLFMDTFISAVRISEERISNFL